MRIEKNILCSESVDVIVLRNDYKNAVEALNFIAEANEAIYIALKFAARNAETIQDCKRVRESKFVNPGDRIFKMTQSQISKVGRKQIMNCKSIESALEILDVATHDFELQNIALLKAIDLLSSFEKIQLIIDKMIDDKDLEVYFWSKALKIAKKYSDYELIISNIPKNRYLRNILTITQSRQHKVLEVTLANKTLEELGQLYVNPDYKRARKEIRKNFTEGFKEDFFNATLFSEYKRLFLLFNDFGRSLVPVKSANTFLIPMLRLVKCFSDAQFIYDNAYGDKAILTLALMKMKDYTNNNIRYRIVINKPEFEITEKEYMPYWLRTVHDKVYEI